MVDQKLLRWSALLIIIGQLVGSGLDFVHPSPGGIGNDQATFTTYAHSSSWAAIHLGQFVSTAIFIAGLFILFLALNPNDRTSRVIGLLGGVSAGLTLALEGVLYAVDGVALKQAVDAWINAPAAEQVARFANAQAFRWLEWGTSSYRSLMLGLTLVLLAITIVWVGRIPRLIGCLIGLSGLVQFVLGWSVGTKGFTSANAVPAIGGQFIFTVWTIWLLIVAWRMKVSVQQTSGYTQYKGGV